MNMALRASVLGAVTRTNATADRGNTVSDTSARLRARGDAGPSVWVDAPQDLPDTACWDTGGGDGEGATHYYCYRAQGRHLIWGTAQNDLPTLHQAISAQYAILRAAGS